MIGDVLKNINKQKKVIKTFDCEKYFYEPITFYRDLTSVRKDAFENDERIVFLLTSDFYDEKKLAGQFFTLIQKFCNDIDISNCFITIITTNSFANEEYDWIYHNENFDGERFEIIVCSGEFILKSFNEHLVFYRQQNYKELIKKLDFTDNKVKDVIDNNKSFCVLPWLGINVESNSRIRFCCESSDIVGDATENTIEEAWNSEKAKEIRKSMLLGEKISGCKNCYVKEKYKRDSLRQSSNRKFVHHVKNLLDNTDSHGNYNKFELTYIDIRYNNLCNLACRSCGSDASSSWHKANLFLDKNFKLKQPSGLLIAGNDEDDIYNQVLKHIDTIETIYFAGGEPLIIDKFYDILEILIHYKKFDVELIYNTNLTKTKLKSRNIFELWKKFPNVSVGASLDAQEKRAEYIRTNTKWKNVEKNRKLMMEECPHIDFHVSATTSILNALHVPDFHYSWVKSGLIKPEEFNIQILFTPKWLSISQAPQELKRLIKEKYDRHLEWLRPIDKNGRATFGYESILEHIKSNEEFDKESFWHETNLLDKFYKQNILDYIPELSVLPR